MEPSRKFNSWFVLIFLLGVAALAYGLYANQLGFYWDDWGFAWIREFIGNEGLQQFNLVRAPLRTLYDSPLTYLLGTNPLAWQVFSILTRWYSAVALWWFLRKVWPSRERVILVTTLLFLVYPGFTQQPIAMIYNYSWAILGTLFISFGLMFLGSQKQKLLWLSMAASVLLSGLVLFGLDYFAGLELLRPLFLWIAVGNITPDLSQRFRKFILYYLPFLGIFLAMLYWRLLGFKDAMYKPFALSNGGENGSIANLLATVFHALKEVSLNSWGKVFSAFPTASDGSRFITIYILIIVLSTLGIGFYLRRASSSLSEPMQGKPGRTFTFVFLGVGIMALLVAGIPAYSSGMPILLRFPDDRLTLPFILGVSMIFAGLLELIPSVSQRVLLASIFIALAIGFHLENAKAYRDDWKDQRNFIWQLSWRAPALERGTVLITDDLTSLPYNDDEALTFIVNWTYAPETRSYDLPYAVLVPSVHLGKTIPSLEEHLPIQLSWVADFQGSTDQAIVVWYDPPSCLRILDPQYEDEYIHLYLDDTQPWRSELDLIQLMPNLTFQALPLSRPELVISDPERFAQPPEQFFGSEPPHEWCYYFEKADLSRQLSDWEEVVRLGDAAFSIPRYPVDFSEYLLFIEGYTRLKHWEEAQDYTFKVARQGPVLMPALCAIWQRAEENLDLTDGDQQVIQDMKEYLGACPYP